MGKIKKEYGCSLVLANDLIGGKWKLRILWHIMHGDNRFSLLVKAIPDISQKVLASQIKELEISGILIKHIIDDTPPKIITYEISKEYEELKDVMERICNFTTQYANNQGIELKG